MNSNSNPASTPQIRLTQTVKKGGCAAKVAAQELRQILSQVEFPPVHPELLVDGRHFDDAAIYQVTTAQATAGVAMVQTLDFFTPILDTPKKFGAVAAANAISDVYAMGGRPKTCMAILAFPLGELANQVIVEVLQGASDVIKKAGATLVGGHSIDDETLKFGLSVTGFVDPQKVWANTGAKKGDILILTKALGTGTITAALKREAVSESEIEATIASMCQLNNVIDYLSEAQLTAIHAATDITGFGLAGHGYQMAKASGVSFDISFQNLPLLPMAEDFLQREFLTKAHRTNREYTRGQIAFEALSHWQEQLFFDPQTSGGLLLSVAPEQAESIVQSLKSEFKSCQIIGTVKDPALQALSVKA